jgi:hypothetical protein
MGCRNDRERDLVRELRRFIGETVTIFTTSGGESGRGFTGVLIGITSDPVVRLLANIGPAPGCALGSCCDRRRRRCDEDEEEEFESRSRRNMFDEEGEEEGNERRSRRSRSRSRRRFECDRIRDVGAVVDIPVNRIAAFVHNAI